MIEDDRRWFGGLPPSWSDAPIGYHFDVILGKMINARHVVNGGISAPYLAAGSIQPDHLLLDDTKRMDFSMTELRKYSLKRDDIVVVEGGAGYGRSHLLKDDLVGWGFQNHVARVRQRSGAVLPEFLVYVLKACLASGFIEANNRTATLPSLSSDVLGKIIAPMPSPDEQRAIADYLDKETAQIDALVAKQERLVGLLRERRSSIVDLLLMSGSSGKGRLKNLLAQNDSGVWGDDAKGGDGTVVLRSTEQTVDGNWKISEPALRELSENELNAARLEVGDLVLTKTSGSPRHIGKATLVDERVATLPACHGNFMQRLRAKSGVSARFLWHCLNSRIVREQLVLLSTTSTGLANLNGESIGSVLVPAHRGVQQTAIADHIDEQTSHIDTLIAKAEEHIALAKERRSALITAAVTGQFDVRTARKAG